MSDKLQDTQDKTLSKAELLEMATDIVAAYVSHNSLDAVAVPDFLEQVFAKMDGLVNQPEPEAEKALNPAVPVEESITEDYLICLEDGKAFKSLKRHLRTKFDLTPEAYREKWGLPADYPMVAPSYAAERSKLAKKMGLGRADS